MLTSRRAYKAQELHRVDRAPEILPRYRTVFWNCHDYAVYFAILVVEQHPPSPALRELAAIVEDSKFIFCREHEEHIARVLLFSLWIGTVTSLLYLFDFSMARVFSALALLSITLCSLYHFVWKTQQMQALQERDAWLHILERRFPKLSALRDRSHSRGLTTQEFSWFPKA
jgi:hypothetical protein